MAFEGPSEGGIDYAPCRYGMSKLLFRGPRRDTTGDFVAFLGSTETYGKFIQTPFPERVSELTGLPTVNFGCINAGVDTFHDDDTVVSLCRRARVCVVQVMGADRLSNRLYSVHARRNDRFVRATATLSRLYPQVDFAEIHFTRHLLATLRAADASAFGAVVESLARDWCDRMESLIARLKVPVILLHLSGGGASRDDAEDPGCEPLFVTPDILKSLESRQVHLLEVPSPAFDGDRPVPGMAFSDVELPMAQNLPGPDIHDRVAKILSAPLKAHWARKCPARTAARDLVSGP